MATLKQVYVTSDNETFENEADANAHEASLELKAKLAGYCAAAGLNKAETTTLTNHVLAFHAYVEKGTAPAVKVRKPRKPKTTAASA